MSPSELALDPVTVGAVARRWDDQHVDLRSAGRRIGETRATGFTTGVSGHAARFAAAWSRAAITLGDTCEAHADSMRSAIADALAVDELSGFELQAMLPALWEVR